MDRGTPTAAPSARRVRFLLSGVVALAVLAGAGIYLARGGFSPGPASGRPAVASRTTTAGCGAATSPCAGNAAGVAMAVTPAVVTVPPHQAAAHQTGTGASPSAPASSRSPSPRPGGPAAGTASAQPSGSATAPAGTASASTASASPPASQGGTAATQVLALINQARSAAGLPALTITSGLQASSSAHNLRMAGGCGLSHQCPGEPAIGDRETAAGVHWTAAGENIGEGGPVAGTSAAIAQMATGITQSMLNEKPPNDGHRQNILSSTFTHIGIAVYRMSSGTVWLTQDFSN
jgi:uncharacterized protein YkwD